MGWLYLYSCPTKQDLINHLVEDYKLEDYSVRGNVLYGLYPFHSLWLPDDFGTLFPVADSKQSAIVICLLDCDRSNPEYPMWGYKDMGEGAYPYSFDCPERILAASTVPDTSGWRAACREKRKTRLVEGQWYEFAVPCHGETRWQYLRQRRYQKRDVMYWRSENGQEFRIPTVGERYKPKALPTPLP
jgi:hypothetical protein